MKRDTNTIFPLIFLIGIFVLLSGCGKQAAQLDQSWSSPIAVTGSKSGLSDGVDLYKWHDRAIMLQWESYKSARYFVMKGSNSWAEMNLTGVPNEYLWVFPALDPSSDKVFFEQGYIENDQLVISVIAGRMTESVTVRNATETKWTADTKGLFGGDHPDVKMAEFNEPRKRRWPDLRLGIIDGSNLYIPYYLEGFTYKNGVSIARGPDSSGVLHSADSGMTWQVERISDFGEFDPLVCKTKDYYYYFAKRGMNIGLALWFSRKPTEGSSWEKPGDLAKTYAMVYGHYAAVAEEDTVHACWMDRRHNKWRLNIDGPNVENDDIVYRRRKDSDTDWSKDVILSKGLLYSYSPSISVEGNNVVVAWSGIASAGKQHTEYDPNDIFYVTSKDGGKTWAKPLNITDGAKDGIVSGKPQVMLLNGVIHLFYTQGKPEKAEQLSPGLTRLSQSSWPIYYQQRPFPK